MRDIYNEEIDRSGPSLEVAGLDVGVSQHEVDAAIDFLIDESQQLDFLENGEMPWMLDADLNEVTVGSVALLVVITDGEDQEPVYIRRPLLTSDASLTEGVLRVAQSIGADSDAQIVKFGESQLEPSVLGTAHAQPVVMVASKEFKEKVEDAAALDATRPLSYKGSSMNRVGAMNTAGTLQLIRRGELFKEKGWIYPLELFNAIAGATVMTTVELVPLIERDSGLHVVNLQRPENDPWSLQWHTPGNAVLPGQDATLEDSVTRLLGRELGDLADVDEIEPIFFANNLGRVARGTEHTARYYAVIPDVLEDTETRRTVPVDTPVEPYIEHHSPLLEQAVAAYRHNNQ